MELYYNGHITSLTITNVINKCLKDKMKVGKYLTVYFEV